MERNCLSLRKTPQKIRTFFKVSDGLLSDAVTALVFSADGTLFAGTDKGLCCFDGKKFFPVSGVKTYVNVIFACNCGKLFVGSGKTLYILKNKKVLETLDFNEDIVDICSDGVGNIWLVTSLWLYKYIDGKFTRWADFELTGTLAMTASGDSKVYSVCPSALQILHGKRPRWGSVMPANANIPTVAINALAADDWGYVWCGSDDGLLIYDGRNTWLTPEKYSEILPKCKITKIVFGKDGSRYIGTELGLYVQIGTHHSFLGAYRWLPAPKVTAIAVNDSGEIWTGTDCGISRIVFKDMSLAEKAEYYDDTINKFHVREGYINSCKYNEDMSESLVNISDNDGLWTSIYVAGESFRYALTGEAEAAALARRSMNAMLKLLTISGIEGFPARAYRRPGEDRFGDGDIEWHLTKDEIGELEWKGETSSDEMVGHYYAAAWYYDLVADEKEKKVIAETIQKVTDHVLSHEYTLCDVDSLPATWSHWSPDELNHNDMWFWEKGINSLELLTFLKVTYHMTGDEKYQKEYELLVKKHHYALNVIGYKIHDNYSCHIDDKLGFLSIHLLMTYEKDPQLLKYYQLGLKRHFDIERIERCPTWSFIYGALTNEPCDIENAVVTLQETPLDYIHYNMNNSSRPDVVIDYSPTEFGGRPQAKIPLPNDERPTGRLTYNAFGLDDNRDSTRHAESPATWIFPYWLGRYYKLFSE